MSDLISRQNTADAMERWLYDGEDNRTVREVVYELPSAKPERKKGKWIDSRKEAILRLKGMKWHIEQGNPIWPGKDLTLALDMAIEALMAQNKEGKRCGQQ